MIEDVEGLHLELTLHTLCYGDVLDYRRIRKVVARADK